MSRILVINYFNDVQHPTHALSASENSTSAWKVGAARRSSTHYWTPNATNSAHWVKVDCGAAKPADMLVIDRVHNLGSITGIKLQKSSDNFATNIVDVATFAVPSSASGDNTSLSSGVRTPEGAFLISFGSTSERYWRLLIPAMGAGNKPQIGGLWLGPSWDPPAIQRPVSDDDLVPLAEATTTPWGWEGRTLTVRRRVGAITIELVDEASYLTADDHVREQMSRRPFWLVLDESKAERAFLARITAGTELRLGYSDPSYPYRRIEFRYEEYEPKVE